MEEWLLLLQNKGLPLMVTSTRFFYVVSGYNNLVDVK